MLIIKITALPTGVIQQLPGGTPARNAQCQMHVRKEAFSGKTDFTLPGIVCFLTDENGPSVLRQISLGRDIKIYVNDVILYGMEIMMDRGKQAQV